MTAPTALRGNAVASRPGKFPAPRRIPRVGLQLTVSLTLITVIVAAAILAPWVAPYGPLDGDPSSKYLPIGADGHLLGTDELGRDLLSRVIYGARTSLLLSVASVAGATVVGTVVGLLAAFTGPRISAVIMRATDVAFAFPVILVAIALAALLGTGKSVVVIAVVIAVTPYVTRIVFSEAKTQRELEYVEAARSLGARRADIIFREVFPNISASVVVYATGLVGTMIVFSASLSAVGIGVQPPEADWGQMIASGAKVVISGNMHVAVVPGLAVLVTSLAFTWLGDALNDRFHTRTRGEAR
ncbi:Glutathione transport system permease protein GsiD [Corynebacterium provencense]|uniref:Glutathione transport system permease protein GsiD n=1 Tax=Corynebacterium provencense TaxID=1737425 RepID=A0A2Z3YTE3_9CORY|nr:ABC transporter permease [Corynebacterium provencense]AWT26961.1 Glutathione transport system permease protein GsiD [Corynebacterium provencense]